MNEIGICKNCSHPVIKIHGKWWHNPRPRQAVVGQKYCSKIIRHKTPDHFRKDCNCGSPELERGSKEDVLGSSVESKYFKRALEKARVDERERIFKKIEEGMKELGCADEISYLGKFIVPWTPAGCAVFNHIESIIKTVKQKVENPLLKRLERL